MSAIRYVELNGSEALRHLEAIAMLRIVVFAEWPYLYDGSFDYEKKYLESYFKSANSFVVLALDGEKIVGASTAIWLQDADAAFQKPFLEKGYALDSVCYYGESVLMGDYRGRGAGKEFMARRERFARRFAQVRHCAFCAVVRPDGHPKRATDYVPHDAFWSKIGFSPVQGMVAHFEWKDLGEKAVTDKTLQFWLKKI